MSIRFFAAAVLLAVLLAVWPAAGLAAAPSAPGGPANAAVFDASRGLAETLAAGLRALKRPEVFHRVAIPDFRTSGRASEAHHLGRLAAALVEAQLAERPPFVVVERERLEAGMRAHRLGDLGALGDGAVAQLGRALGVESVVAGAVTEAGPSYAVTARLVDVALGRTVATAEARLERDGLEALASRAVVERTRLGGALRSAVVPGWGQLYHHTPAKGAAFLALGLGALGAAGGFYGAAFAADQRYREDTAERVGERALANERVRIANLLLIGYGVVWTVSLIDALVDGSSALTVELPAFGDRP